MKPHIEYARTEYGVSVAYWTRGKGAPFVHMTPGTTACDGEWEIPECRHWYEQLADRWRLVRYSNRGEGLSNHGEVGRSLEDSVKDLAAVVDGLGLDRFVLFAPWYAGPPAIAYAARLPERLSHLILWCTFASGEDWARQPEFRAVRALADKDWTVYTETVAHVILGWSQGASANRYAALLRDSVTPEFVQGFYAGLVEWDVSNLLSQVSVPTLVMHRKGHSLGLDVAKGLAAGIPNARLALLDGNSVAPYLGDTAAVFAAIVEFVGEQPTSSVDSAGLTSRERDVLRLIAAGRSNRQIAEELTISTNTADRHVSNILTKIGAANRAEAASFAVRNGLA